MDEIRVGDLVMVVRTHCSLSASGGKIGEVSDVGPSWTGEWICGGCRQSIPTTELFAHIPSIADIPGDADSGWHPLAWLKRIPPLTEPESIEHTEEITA